jgi:hypothetical protein
MNLGILSVFSRKSKSWRDRTSVPASYERGM